MLFTEEVLGDKLTSARAVEVHREIGVAVGILLADEELSSDQAYRRLHEASRALSTSLPDVARHVIAHRGLPGT
jgi:AmiR/NasT family two-component response regulator